MAWDVPSFYIPVNPNQGAQIASYADRLLGAFDQGRADKVDTQRRAINAEPLGVSGQGGAPDFGSRIQKLLAIGDFDGAAKLGTIQRSLRDSDPAAIQEFNLARSQGFKGSFMDYQTALKQAGATRVNTTVNPAAGENEFSKQTGKAQAEYFDKLVQNGADAAALEGDIGRLRAIGERIQTGKGAEAIAALGPWAQSLGIDVKGLPDIQAYEAIVNRMAPRMRVPGSGATSDFDASMFLKSLPGLGKTPEGNQLIMDTMRGVINWQRAAANIASAARSNAISRDEAERRINALPDPYTAWRKANPQAEIAQTTPQPATDPQTGQPMDAFPQVRSQQEYQALPKGQRYVGPDGKMRVKQ